jgi:hypothetical protein
LNPHLLCIGGFDHHLRLPFLKALRDRGFQVSAAGTGAAAPFETAGAPEALKGTLTSGRRTTAKLPPIQGCMALGASTKAVGGQLWLTSFPYREVETSLCGLLCSIKAYSVL